MTPATWSAVIATMGLATTALFSFFNFRITQESFNLQHPPIVNVSQVLVEKRGNGLSTRLIVSNTGEGDAKDIVISFMFPLVQVDSKPVSIRRHEMRFVTLTLPVIEGWRRDAAVIGDITVAAKNSLGQSISQASTCVVLHREDVVAKASSEEFAILFPKDCQTAYLESVPHLEPIPKVP